MVAGKIMSNPGSQFDEYVFKTKRFTNFVKAILFRLDEKDTTGEGAQSQVHHVPFLYVVGPKKG